MPVCGYIGDQLKPVVVGDGSGGAIIAWEDWRVVGYSRIYALRISGDTGKPSWTEKAVTDSTPTLVNQSSPDIASDGDGGAIITWQETMGTKYLIRAQRIGPNGDLPWGLGARIASQSMQPQEFPKIINDGTECVIITWQDMRGVPYDIYAQKMELITGTTLWASNGNAVTQAAYGQVNPEIVSDGQGGAIITWTDYRKMVSTDPDIYAQWISSGGVPVWTPADGIPVCKMDREQSNPVIVNSLLGNTTDGAIIAWEDRRSDTNGDIYAEKVPLDASFWLTGNGKAMATGNQIQKCPRLVSDNNGGGIITWIEKDSIITDGYKIFASKRNQNGDPVWSMYPGVQVCQASNIVDHQIVSDGSGGAIIAWQSGPSTDYNIYAQRVVEDGTMLTSASISGRVTLPDGETGITGVEVEAFKDGELKYSVITDIYGKYDLTSLVAYSTYTVRATWMCNDIVSSVSKEAYTSSYGFNFTLEISSLLARIGGIVSGVGEKCIASLSCPQAKRISGTGLQRMLSPGNGIGFVELEQRGKAIVRVPVETDGNYSIPNLLPGRFVARAYNGSIYSNPRMVNLKEGETLRVDFAFGIMPEETVFNYPNPAKKGSTTITYYCEYPDPEAEIRIYGISGELVRKVKDSEIDKAGAPIYNFLWDCKNSSGKEVASGVYIYAVEVKEKSSGETKKVIKRMAVIR
jgi:hypothetical protein